MRPPRALGALLLVPAVVAAQPRQWRPAPAETAAEFTFRLDRFTGDVVQLVLRPDDSHAWGETVRRPHPAGDPRVDGQVNDMLLTSGFAACWGPRRPLGATPPF
jgi:hypothetical protein